MRITEHKGPASTHSQALNALLFLYREVPGINRLNDCAARRNRYQFNSLLRAYLFDHGHKSL